MQRTPFVLSRKYKIHAYSFKYRYLSIKHIIFATLSLNSFWCCFRASKRLFLGVKRRNCLQFVEFSGFFSNTPATLLHSPTAFPALCALPSKFHGVVPLTGVWQKTRFSGRFEVFFVPENALPDTVKLTFRCNFYFFMRVCALKLARNGVYATHARFRPGFAVWFRAHSNPPKPLVLVQKRGWGWCRNGALGQIKSLRLDQFFSRQGTCMNFNRANL